MEFVFDEKRAAQAAGYLLLRHGGAMPYITLIKLLYLADRRALIETGYPITGDRMVSMPHGPVLSRVLDLIKGNDDEGSVWRTYVSPPEGYRVKAVGPSDEGALSDYDRATLDYVLDKFVAMDWRTLVDYTHTLPEWTDPKGSSLDIDPLMILQAAGYSDEEREDIEEVASSVRSLRNLYASLG